jgi:nitroreductase
VVEEEELKRSVADPQFWAADAPVMIVALGLESPEEQDVHYPQFIDSIREYHKNGMYMLDVGIAFEHLVLAATNLRLATCWMSYSWDRNAEMRELLGVPDKYRVIARTPLGFPDEQPQPKSRKSLDEIVSWERFGYSYFNFLTRNRKSLGPRSSLAISS